MEKRALAHIEKVEWVKPIEGADNIELIGVLGWICIAKKDEFKAGDLAVYIEIDSKCPMEDKRFAFLENRKYKIKTMKLSRFNVISQGIALPITMFDELKRKKVGSDVTDILGITYAAPQEQEEKTDIVVQKMQKNKFAKNPVIKALMRYEWFRNFMRIFLVDKNEQKTHFPNWIMKTDEVRIENTPKYLESTEKWVVTEKLDGTSCTYAVNQIKKGKYEFFICSRNQRIIDKHQSVSNGVNIYWKLAEKYQLEEILKNFAKKHGYRRVILQGEGIGNVQGNPYQIKGDDFYVFNLIIEGQRLGTIEMSEICKQLQLKHVPIIETEYYLPKTMQEIKEAADGTSAINPNVKREGLVYRAIDGVKSFKNVSNSYLLKKKN
ncbi:MAG: hypothetical protein IKJ01_07660 [Lachnospiraceae bacterium]|nr:hypothetical protein [Lachnospiraceae bacterium]